MTFQRRLQLDSRISLMLHINAGLERHMGTLIVNGHVSCHDLGRQKGVFLRQGNQAGVREVGA